MRSMRPLAISIMLAICLLGNAYETQSQDVSSANCRYFAKTGHYVCDQFLDFFKTRGGLEVFGYPRTEAFTDPTHGGLRVQYFQRARMEHHPLNSPPYAVQLGLLVDELGTDYPPALPEELPTSEGPSQHYFPETQHVVSYAFLDFFREHGGIDIFGYPRSEMVYENGLVVQYFQRARMEWYRRNAPGQQIILSNVGDWYIERFDIPGDYDLRRPPPPRGRTRTRADRHIRLAFLPVILSNCQPGRPGTMVPSPTAPSAVTPTPTTPSATVTGLDVSASVRYPISGRTGTQTVFVYVDSQEGDPIAGAEANLVVHYLSGDVTCVAGPTDASGATRCSFEIPSPPVGKRVVIDIIVTYQGLTATTQTFFMPWW